MRDLGHFMRSRFARYAATLREWAEEDGVRGIPFVVNIHGTGGGRGFTFPVGISQLMEAARGRPSWMTGTDIYLGNLTMDTFQDLYVLNAFTDAVNDADQPLASVEFECGDGNYGQALGGRYDPSAVDMKARMCVGQGARLLNYYLFAGGRNGMLDPVPGDGNDRIAITGERHGFAAPISPEGTLNYTWPRMVRGIAALRAAGPALAAMDEERDGLALAFIPDWWMTESRYPGSRVMADVCAALEEGRGYGAWEIMVRALLHAGFRFGARNVQDGAVDPAEVPVLALGSARYMDAAVQDTLAGYVEAGGGLLVYGELPTMDMEGAPCAVLAAALGAEPGRVRRESDLPGISLTAHGWAAPRPELRTGMAQAFRRVRGEVLLRVQGTSEPCAFDAPAGKGRAIVIAAGYSCDVPLFREAARRLGAVPGLAHDCPDGGIFMTSMASAGGARVLHVMNLDGFEKRARIILGGKKLFGGRALRLAAREAVLLPLDVQYAGVTVVSSTAEVLRASPSALVLRPTQERDVIVLAAGRRVAASRDYAVERKGPVQVVTSRLDARLHDTLTVRFAPGARDAPAHAPRVRTAGSRNGSRRRGSAGRAAYRRRS
jgi:beta-galactosidase